MIDEERLNKFMEAIRKGYLFRRELSKFSTILKYEKGNGDFKQFPDRVKLPKEDFSENWKVNNTFLGQQIGESVGYGEMNYFIKQITETITPKQTIDYFDYKKFIEIIGQLPFTPTHILLPIEPYFKEVHNWTDLIKYDSEGLKLIFGNNKIEVEFSNRYLDFKDVIILDKSGIFTHQKTVKNMIPIPEFRNYKNLTDDDNILQILMGEDLDQYDFIVRSVLSIQINNNSVVRYIHKN